MYNFEKETKRLCDIIEDSIKNLLENPGINYQKIIIESMQYSVSGKSKRMRPILLLKTYETLKNEKVDKDSEIVKVASAIEFIHTSSLIHDDLPSIDNSDLRRGKPSCHVAFNEGIALLTGDALLLHAFQTITNCKKLGESLIMEAITLLSGATGFLGMIGGQTIDIMNDFNKDEELNREKLIYMSKLKTAELIKTSILLGAFFALKENKTENFGEIIEGFSKFSETLGIAYQVKDDILDFKSDDETLGKTTKNDEKNKKFTFVTLMGIDGACQELKKMKDETLSYLLEIEKTLDSFGIVANMNFIETYTKNILSL